MSFATAYDLAEIIVPERACVYFVVIVTKEGILHTGYTYADDDSTAYISYLKKLGLVEKEVTRWTTITEHKMAKAKMVLLKQELTV